MGENHSKRREPFFDWDFKKDVDTSVKVYQSKEKYEKGKAMTESQIKMYREESKRGTAVSRNSRRQMGYAQSEARDERIFKLRTAIEQGKVYTVKAGAKLVGVQPSTILRYLKDMNVGIYDTERKRMVKFNDETKLYYPEGMEKD